MYWMVLCLVIFVGYTFHQHSHLLLGYSNIFSCLMLNFVLHFKTRSCFICGWFVAMYNIVKETRAFINLDNKEAKMSLLEGNTRVYTKQQIKEGKLKKFSKRYIANEIKTWSFSSSSSSSEHKNDYVSLSLNRFVFRTTQEKQ